MRQIAIPCLMIRGGTSKGPYFSAADLPSSVPARDQVLLTAMGSPDDRQIDGLGGSDSLTSKVAIVVKSARPGVVKAPHGALSDERRQKQEGRKYRKWRPRRRQQQQAAASSLRINQYE